MRKHLTVTITLLALCAACSEFPCTTESSTRTLATIPVNYEEQTRYTYWFEDGAQRVVFDREAIPETARAAVLVHVGTKTEGGLHGATGWAADVSDDNGAIAEYVPMAMPRSQAYASWAGDWTGDWVRTSAARSADAAVRQRAMEAALANDTPVPVEEKTIDKVPGFREELSNEGITLDGLQMGRALRGISARQPLPRDFGLSAPVHPTWLFVDPDCAACDGAEQWLGQRGIAHHAMLTSDPTNARTLRDLTRRAGFKEVGVPTLWRDGKLTQGFDPSSWDKGEQ